MMMEGKEVNVEFCRSYWNNLEGYGNSKQRKREM